MFFFSIFKTIYIERNFYNKSLARFSMQRIILRHSEEENRLPNPNTMLFGEVYVNSSSGEGKTVLITKKGEDSLSFFTEKDYNESHYGNKTTVDTINAEYIKSAVMDETASVPSVTNNVLTIPTITTGTVETLIEDNINDLNGSATIATLSGNIVSIKTNITEQGGIISNGAQSDIVLSEVAKTGSASNLSVNYNSSDTDTQTAITNIASRLNSIETTSHINTIVCEPVASEIPNIATYVSGTTTIVGTLEPSVSTISITYLVKNDDSYNQYTTTQNNDVYSWVNLGSTSVDLNGYIKEVSLNNQTYTASGVRVTLPEVITEITGESEIANSVSGLVSVNVTTGSASSGSKNATITSKIKTQDISTSSSSNDGVALAKNVKDYVTSNLTTIKTWRDSDIIN